MGHSRALSVTTQDASLVKMGMGGTGSPFSITCGRQQWSEMLIPGLSRDRQFPGLWKDSGGARSGCIAKEKVVMLALCLHSVPVSPRVCQEGPSVDCISCITSTCSRLMTFQCVAFTPLTWAFKLVRIKSSLSELDPRLVCLRHLAVLPSYCLLCIPSGA